LASGIILSHNHPSGSLKPSDEDKKATQKIKDGCRILDITLIDHLILTPDGNYLSFADEGLL
jgi:DNA repair protein RadC